MTTSQEWEEKLLAAIPPAELPRHHSINGITKAGGPMPPPIPNTQAGDPGPSPPPANLSPVDEDLAYLGDAAKRCVDYQFATLALLAGYASMFRHVQQALEHLKPGDIAAMPQLRDELANAIASADRALHPQAAE